MSRTGKWIIIAIIIAIIIVLFRMKAIAPAGILSGLLGVAALVGRMLQLRNLYNQGKPHTQTPHAAKSGMSYRDALELLELPKNPTKQQVNTAYKKMMERNHPDKGGSKVFAAQINEARDVVMRGMREK